MKKENEVSYSALLSNQKYWAQRVSTITAELQSAQKELDEATKRVVSALFNREK